MTIGDGVRRDIALVSQAERDRFIAAILQLDSTTVFTDGVTYWDKQEDIHTRTPIMPASAFTEGPGPSRGTGRS